MVTTSPDLLVADAVLALLRTTSRRVYDGQYEGAQPAPRSVYPFAVFYPLLGGRYAGEPLTAPDRHVTFLFQCTATGLRRDQTQALASELQDLAWSRTAAGGFQWSLPVAGFTVLDRAPSDSPAGVTPVGEPPNRVWNAPVRFTVTVTPTS